MSIRQAFTPIGNLKTLFVRPKANLAPIDGLRAISALMVVAFHSIYLSKFFVSPEIFFALAKDIPVLMRIFWVGDLAIDIFFAISGFLISGLLIQEHQKQGRVRYGQFYMRRYLRLTPVYLVTILIYGLIGGPNSENLWANVLYVNNFLPMEKAAMSWTWSLAVEEQFYLLFPLVMSLLVLSKPRALVNLYALLLLSFILRFILMSQNTDLWHANLMDISFNDALFSAYYNEIYVNLYTRFGGFICGAIAAHYFYVEPGRLTHFMKSATLVNLLTIAALILIVGVLFNGFRTEPEQLPHSLHSWYLLLVRNVFSMAIAWLIIASLMPSGIFARMVRFALAARFWYPLAQLSYSIYLVHFMVVTSVYVTVKQFFDLQSRSLDSLGYMDIIQIFLFSAVISVVLAAIAYLCIEKPIMNLRKARNF